MSYNGSGTFQINTTGQPVVTGTVISSTAFNALTADLATGLSTAITKDGQTATTARIPFAQGITSTLVTDSSSVSTGSIITDGGVGIAKNLYVGGTLNVTGSTSFTNPTINNIKMGYSTTATAAGTTTLTVSSNYRQFFTGSTTQTIVLPVTSTLVTGMAFEIENNSTGLLTVNSSGGNLVGTIPAGVCAHAVCIGTTLTTAADWDWDYISTSTITGTGANVLGTSPTITTPTIDTVTATVAVVSASFKSSGNYTIEYQLIAGGGGGSASAAGGGGGGVTQGGLSVTVTTGYTVTIGAAGAIAGTGGDTSLTGATTAKGGGAGPAGVGGSSAGNTDSAAPSARTAGTSNQGNGGGNGTSGTVGGGGGGGAGSPGGDGSSSSGYGGLGGAGILGFDGNFYSGGGGGAGQNGVAFGGNGGGGNGGKTAGPAATSGGTNTGGGGGGGYAVTGAAGGSGKAIIRYFGAQRGTGGTISSVGGWTYHVFTASGTFTA